MSQVWSKHSWKQALRVQVPQLLLALRTPYNSWQHGSQKACRMGPQAHQVAVVLQEKGLDKAC